MDLILKRRVIDFVAEYEDKKNNIETALNDFNAAGEALKLAATIAGTFGEVSLDTGRIYKTTLEESLKKSAWRHIYNF